MQPIDDVIDDLSTVDSEDADWQRASYEQFLRDDSPEDAIYDNWPMTNGT